MAKAFTAEPQDVSVHLEDTAMLPCDIDGSPSPSVRWFKDEQEIQTETRATHLIHADGTLEIQGVQFQDFGRYKCRVENDERSKTSQVAQLLQDSDHSEWWLGAQRLMWEG